MSVILLCHDHSITYVYVLSLPDALPISASTGLSPERLAAGRAPADDWAAGPRHLEHGHRLPALRNPLSGATTPSSASWRCYLPTDHLPARTASVRHPRRARTLTSAALRALR